ncbi:MAG: hypothetical protein QM770_24115 [Tepidisphaeraceae bacterium]
MVARDEVREGAGCGRRRELAHAGRKASTLPPFEGGGAATGSRAWTPIGASAVPFSPKYPTPTEMTRQQIDEVIAAFAAAAKRAVSVGGFDLVEVHAAHGYLLHSFYSPLSNQRTDDFGGSFANRVRLTREVVRAVRSAIPDGVPISVRLSCTDWTEGGWTIDDSVELSKLLTREDGADLIDCSSGGNVPRANIPLGPGYQVPLAERVKRDAGATTAAVGLITEPKQADDIVREGKADLVLLARAALRDPNFPLNAARALDQKQAVAMPKQYDRAW